MERQGFASGIAEALGSAKSLPSSTPLGSRGVTSTPPGIFRQGSLCAGPPVARE